MSKLYAMNICLFIFLFHFVSNKERFFFIFNDNVKCEFTLNRTSESGKVFYKELKKNKTIQFNLDYKNNFLSGSINMYVEGDWNEDDVIHLRRAESTQEDKPHKKGEIAYRYESHIGNLLYIFPEDNSIDVKLENVGKIIE